MGMFDKPQYLTGKDGLFKPGETFWLFDARADGSVTIDGEERPQAKLLVSRSPFPVGAKVAYTSGKGIVSQIARMDDADRGALPMEVRLDELPATSASRNGTLVLTPATTPAVEEQASF